MEQLSLLEKLALEVSKNDSKQSESKGNKFAAGGEKTPGGKGFPPKSEKENSVGGDKENKAGSNDEKKNGKAFPFGKKTKEENGENDDSGEDGEKENSNVNGKDNSNGTSQEKGNESGHGNEQEIEGGESNGVSAPVGGSPEPLAIMDFFAQNPTPDDASFHEFAESQGIDVHQAEAIAYALAGKYVMFLRGGNSGGGQLDLSQIDPDQLNKGIEVEYEHSGDPTTAKKIALDHLTEFPDYYTRLEQMESAGGQVVAEPKNDSGNQDQENGEQEVPEDVKKDSKKKQESKENK